MCQICLGDNGLFKYIAARTHLFHAGPYLSLGHHIFILPLFNAQKEIWYKSFSIIFHHQKFIEVQSMCQMCRIERREDLACSSEFKFRLLLWRKTSHKIVKNRCQT